MFSPALPTPMPPPRPLLRAAPPRPDRRGRPPPTLKA